jgi:biopolymer transport protein ExbD/biopolymer transport protein TolR
MAFSTGPHKNGTSFRPLAEINVTPLVDVMLVLLIVFMVTAPIIAPGIKVDLPQATAAKTINPPEPVVISITDDGRLAVGTEFFTKDEFASKIDKLLGTDTKRVIQIRADKNAQYGGVIDIVNTLSHNGFIHIALITNKTGK